MVKKYVLCIWVAFFIFCFTSVGFTKEKETAKAEEGLAGWWKFDEGAGDILYDSSGNGNDGKIYGAKWVKDKRGFSLLFDGKDDYVDCLNTPSTEAIEGSLTMSAWINIPESSLKSKTWNWYCISKHDWNIGIGDSLIPFFESWSMGGPPRRKLSAERRIPTDEWVHLAAVYSVENEVMEFYINGEKTNYEKRSDGGLGGYLNWPLMFGRESLEPLKLLNFSAKLNEIRIYSRALSSDEVKSIYQNVEIKSAPEHKQKQPVDLNLKKLTRDVNDVKLREQFKWLDSKAGMSEEVLAPWTPIEVEKKDKGLAIKVWGRMYYFNDGPFPSVIETKGKRIFAGPIRIIAKVDGKDVSWQWNSFQIEKQASNLICFTREATGKGLVLSGKTQIEYDGMIRIDWKVIPQRSLKLEELFLEIPIQKEYAKYIYTPRYHSKVGYIPKDGWNTSFKPMIWLGDEELGLAWFCESDKDWYNIKQTRSIEVLPDKENKDIVKLRLHLVDREISMKPGIRQEHESGIPIMHSPDNVVELKYAFGLQATPVKPVIKDVWDYRILWFGVGTLDGNRRATPNTGDRFIFSDAEYDSLAERGVKTIVYHEQWTDAFANTSTPYEKELKKLVEEFHKRGIQVLLYLGPMIADSRPEFSFFSEECMLMPKNVWDFTNYPPMPPHHAPTTCFGSIVWQDMEVNGIDKTMMQKYDVDGVYLDGFDIVLPCKNTLHGCGFIDEHGKLRRTYAMFACRQLMKRIYSVVKKNKPEGQINLHNSTFINIPTMTWATSYWDGEQFSVVLGIRGLSKNSPILEQMPLDWFRTEFMGHQFGVPAEFLQGYIFPNSPVTIGVCLLHDVPVRGMSSFLCNLFDKFGRKESEWLPYWRNKDYVTVKPEGGVRLSPSAVSSGRICSAEVKDVYVSLYRHPKNGVLAVVANLSEVETNVKVQFNLQNLKLKGQLSATDETIDWLTGILAPSQINISDGAFEVKLSSGAWKIIWIK